MKIQVYIKVGALHCTLVNFHSFSSYNTFKIRKSPRKTFTLRSLSF